MKDRAKRRRVDSEGDDAPPPLTKHEPLTAHLLRAMEGAAQSASGKAAVESVRLQSHATWADAKAQMDSAAPDSMEWADAATDHFLKATATATTCIERHIRQYSAPLVAVVCGRIYAAVWASLELNPFDVRVDVPLSVDSVDAELRRARPDLFSAQWTRAGIAQVTGPRVTVGALRAAVANAARILADEIVVEDVSDSSKGEGGGVVALRVDLSPIFVLFQPIGAREKGEEGVQDGGGGEVLTEEELHDLANAESIDGSSVGSDRDDAPDDEEETLSDRAFIASDDDEGSFEQRGRNGKRAESNAKALHKVPAPKTEGRGAAPVAAPKIARKRSLSPSSSSSDESPNGTSLGRVLADMRDEVGDAPKKAATHKPAESAKKDSTAVSSALDVARSGDSKSGTTQTSAGGGKSVGPVVSGHKDPSAPSALPATTGEGAKAKRKKDKKKKKHRERERAE